MSSSPTSACQCQEPYSGEHCSIHDNETSPNLDTENVPTREANFTLEFDLIYQDAFNNLSSPESLQFIKTFEAELNGMCKEAFPQGYQGLQVIKLSNGSIVADTLAVYSYPNNETEIQFLNTQLDAVLTDILNDTSNLAKISQAFNVSVQLNEVVFQPPPIANITEMRPFVNCSGFANFTAKVINGQWQCVGPCQTNPDYCNQHGKCQNDVLRGPVCTCYQNSLEQYYGPQCDLFRRGPGFYGALFGSLAGALLLVTIISVVFFLVKKRRTGSWKLSKSNRRLSAFDDYNDFFDFSNRVPEDKRHTK
ncbi:mucin-3B [Acanthochromis polyacanthus]|uniref:mucin-3B n=1 Tax=Acanthochromis polyacanthus TaxID=80966 RepID=UPI002233FE4E|nr:mucin-3B [Acanthochromis polyacanthus]